MIKRYEIRPRRKRNPNGNSHAPAEPAAAQPELPAESGTGVIE
jgi:hypothetical protein